MTATSRPHYVTHDTADLIDRMESHPEEFYHGRYHFEHLPSGLKIWTANGFLYYGPYIETPESFSFLGKIAFAKALRRWRQKYVMACLND